MPKFFEALDDKLIRFIQSQHMFFVATAPDDGKINLSPKGLDSLLIESSSQLVWLNLTGSGNETAAHVYENKRMTIMFCSFDKQPLILRVYGKADLIYPRHADFAQLCQSFPAFPGIRQFFRLKIELIQTSCGFAVPYYEFRGERETLVNRGNQLTQAEVTQYWQEHNQQSLDGQPTGILED